jgi:hypothetical protein
MDDETLNEIADELRARGLDVRTLGYAGIATLSPIWSVIDPEDFAVRVIVTPSFNGRPQFWAEAFCSSMAPYIVPTITKIGDVANEVLVRRASKMRAPLAGSVDA